METDKSLIQSPPNYREMLLEQIAYLDTVLRVYGKIDEEKEPITTAAAKALEQT